MQYGYRTNLFIPGEDGDCIQYPAYNKYFRENTERILGGRLTPHSLRHMHTALLAESDVPLETISQRLGYANSQITRDVYMHVTRKMREKDNSLIKNVRKC